MRVEPSRYLRFCPNCGLVSFVWSCCGQRTRAVSMRRTVSDKVCVSEKEKVKTCEDILNKK